MPALTTYHLVALPYQFFLARSAGDLLMRANWAKRAFDGLAEM
mgnify:CR=1 FL=1